MSVFRSFFCVCLRGAVLLVSFWSVQPSFADAPPVDAVLKSWAGAFSAPVRYQVKLHHHETTVSHKLLADGVQAIRVEAVQGSQTVMLYLGGKVYEVLPQSRIVIDKNHFAVPPIEAKLQGNELSLWFLPDFCLEGTDFILAGTGNVRGAEAIYELRGAVPNRATVTDLPAHATLLRRALGKVRSEVRLKVNRKSLLPTEFESLAADGSSLGVYTFHNIDGSPSFDDDTFEIPQAYTVETPVSFAEYYEIHDRCWDDIRPVPPRHPPFSKYADLQRQREKMWLDFRKNTEVTTDPATGLFLVGSQTVAEAQNLRDAEVEKRLNEAVLAKSPISVFLVLNILAIAVLLVFLIRKQMRS